MRARLLLAAALAFAALGGCANGPARQKVQPVEAINAGAALPENALLDVGVHLFEAEKLDAKAAAERNTYPQILEAEGRYIPFLLKSTLQQTGQWGAVRMVPARAEETDVAVTGKILESNGETLRVQVRVADATGREWFHKEYAAEATEKTYERLEGTDRDPFQDLYNQIANDMLEHRRKLPQGELSTIRRVAELKFARSLAPYAYGEYLKRDKAGLLAVDRLPAEDDPMYQRVTRIHAREQMFIDTVNLYYGNLYDDMREPYRQWRKSYVQELNQKRALEQKVWERRALGLAAIVGALFISSRGDGNSSAGRLASDLLVIGGYEAFRSSGQLANDAKVHEEALKELGASFKSDVAPIVEEVEGRAVKLSGSAETQYAEWRETLRMLFAAETGLSPGEAVPAATPEPAGAR